MKKYLIILLLSFTHSAIAQQLKSPKEHLGYELGEKFTPHYKIVNYFEAAAAARPQVMKLQKYGETYEGRPLYAAFISSPENIARLEQIRSNSMRLSSSMSGEAGNINEPTIVWLSYNVHGNEASSSEVSMKALYELLSPSNPQTNSWLKNTVIIIDPCLNPDGRDRYVNWYNQVAGKNANATPDAREHNEPWPGGRSNHYNFDLNRDWAWQSQVETQQRIKLYSQWMPTIHVDFHEQYPGSPYYFAPAAEPFHEVITPFQRDFQTTIGKNHARYFDANGWLYFTKEYFDLFYPAYGDTYPIYNGAIGMTYEQAGHSLAGLSLALQTDTLTLKDRIDHHFTTTMSTIEVASANAVKLNTEFKKYFDEGKNGGTGIYKSYVVTASQGKLKSLTDLLDRNSIQYGYAGKKAPVRGYNYFTGKEESYTTTENDIVISGFQPRSALLKVLFEPQSKLSDSATYDITAWALPYAYGLQTYAVKERLSVSSAPTGRSTSGNYHEPSYGYLVEYNSGTAGKVLAALLKNNFNVRFAEKDFTYQGKVYNKGTLVILTKGNEQKISQLHTIAHENQNPIVQISSGFMEGGFDFGSDKLHMIKKPVVAMLTGSLTSYTAQGEIWHYFDQQLEYPISLINADDISSVTWKNFDVLIIPDGNYKFLTEKDGNAELKAWLRQGGKIIALQSAVSQMATGEWGIKLKKEEEEKPEDKKPTYADIKRYENRERDGIRDYIPGAIYKVELDNSHPLAFGYPATYFTLKTNSNLYEFMKSGWNVGVIKQNNQVAGFVGSNVREKLKDGTVLAVQQYGRGSIIYFADDPLFRSFWENGKLLFTNAVFLVGQ